MIINHHHMFSRGLVLMMTLFCTNGVSEMLTDNLTIDSVAPDVNVVTHAYPWPSNSLCAVMDNGDILLIDVPYTPEATELLLEWIDIKYGRRNITAITTHFHIDRLGGNAALVKRSIPVFGSTMTLEAVATRGQTSLHLLASWIKEDSIREYFQTFTYVPPTNIFPVEKGLTLYFGSDTVYVKFPGVGHSIDNLFVFMPRKKVFYGGCAVLAADADKIGNVTDGDPDMWLETLRRISTDGYTTVIPGHGKWGGPELVTHTITLLQKVRQEKIN